MAEKNQNNDIIFYTTPTGNVKIEVVFNNETFWLTQKAMAELFGVKVPAISKHLTNIFETNELEENSVISILETKPPMAKTTKLPITADAGSVKTYLRLLLMIRTNTLYTKQHFFFSLCCTCTCLVGFVAQLLPK